MVAATSLSETTAATTLAAVDCLSDRYISKVDKSTISDDGIESEHCQDKETIVVGFNDRSSPNLLSYDCSCALHVALEVFRDRDFPVHGISATSSTGY
jgi:hypothetical protein